MHVLADKHLHKRSSNHSKMRINKNYRVWNLNDNLLPDVPNISDIYFFTPKLYVQKTISSEFYINTTTIIVSKLYKYSSSKIY